MLILTGVMMEIKIKVLISIQSLLMDPYCEVCMEPEVGELYNTDKEAFDMIARYT